MRFAVSSIPLALYVHLPWCVKKCPYCDFNSHELKPDSDLTAYTSALLSDLEEERREYTGDNRTIQSVFFGGGTPSLFHANHIDKILKCAQRLFGFSDNIEVTLEANPGAIDERQFGKLVKAGVNRLSIGVQSFSAEKLKALGRIHNTNDIYSAFRSARSAGFGNINLDVMFGLPEQSQIQAIQDIESAIALSPEHISAYQLTMEPNTLFHKYPPRLPDDDHVWEMQKKVLSTLNEAGYSRYEISAYAQADKQCQHNKNYWMFGDYIGIGAGAHGKQTCTDSIVRRAKTRHPSQYIKQSFESRNKALMPSNIRNLQTNEIEFEFMLNALRLTDGFSTNCYTNRTGRLFTDTEHKIKSLSQQGYLRVSDQRVTPTAKGLAFLNEILQTFLPEEAKDSSVSAEVHH